MLTYWRFTLGSPLTQTTSIIVLITCLFLFLAHIKTILLRDIVITLSQALSFPFPSPKFSTLALLAILKHFHIRLELTVLLDSFQQLYKIKDRRGAYGVERNL